MGKTEPKTNKKRKRRLDSRKKDRRRYIVSRKKDRCTFFKGGDSRKRIVGATSFQERRTDKVKGVSIQERRIVGATSFQERRTDVPFSKVAIQERRVADVSSFQERRNGALTKTTLTKKGKRIPILSAAPTPTTSAAAERPTPDSPAKRKGKATTGRTFGRDTSSSPEEEADQRPAKRRRRYHVITTDSDEDDSSAELPMPKPMQSADPSLSPSI
ncbi:hypothetical protein GQ457_05G014950 [Hibiscus cannabinus]